MRLSLLFLIALQSMAQAAPTRKLSNFELYDQHERLRTYRFPKAKVTLMTVADYRGAKQLEPWIAYAYQRFGRQIDIDGVADVSGMPVLFHDLLRISLRKRLTHSVMLDWDGTVARRFDYQRNIANVYIIDPRGVITDHFSGMARQSGLQELTEAIERALAAQIVTNRG